MVFLSPSSDGLLGSSGANKEGVSLEMVIAIPCWFG